MSVCVARGIRHSEVPVNRRRHILVASVTVLVLVAGGLTVCFLARQGPATGWDANLEPGDPCVALRLDPPSVREDEISARATDLADATEAAAAMPSLPASEPSDMNGIGEPGDSKQDTVSGLVRTVEWQAAQREPEENVIDVALVDVEGHPVPGFVALEGVVSDPNVEPAARLSVPEPTFQPPGGLLGSACDTSGLLGRRFIWRKDAQNTEITLVLEPGATIVGRAVGVDRKPVPGARVSLETLMLDNRWNGLPDPLFAATTDDDGYFQLQGVSVGPRVRAVAFLGTLSGRSASLDLKGAEVADAGEIVLTGSRPGSGIVRGRITDEQDSPVAHRVIRVGIGPAGQNLVTDADGCYTLTDLPTDRSITITIDMPSYGVWSRTTVADDYACDFQVVPQGWGALGREAPPLVADAWFNHAPISLQEARGRVVLLTFRNFTMDRDSGLATIRSLLEEFGSKGLLVVAVYDHLPGGNPVAADLVTTHLTNLFEGAPIAGVLDSDPDLVANLMPAGRPPGVTAGATHWLYQVHERPASFLIDKKGIVRFCEPRENNLRERIVKLLEE